MKDSYEEIQDKKNRRTMTNTGKKNRTKINFKNTSVNFEFVSFLFSTFYEGKREKNDKMQEFFSFFFQNFDADSKLNSDSNSNYNFNFRVNSN